MDVLDRLQRDHEECRILLDALSSALTMRADTWFVVRDLCVTLTNRLRSHMQRETEVLSACHTPLSARELVRLADGHGEELWTLREALEWMADERSRTLHGLRFLLEEAVASCRHHLDEQEYKLFPAMRWVCRMQGSLAVRGASFTQEQAEISEGSPLEASHAAPSRRPA